MMLFLLQHRVREERGTLKLKDKLYEEINPCDMTPACSKVFNAEEV